MWLLYIGFCFKGIHLPNLYLSALPLTTAAYNYSSSWIRCMLVLSLQASTRGLESWIGAHTWRVRTCSVKLWMNNQHWIQRLLIAGNSCALSLSLSCTSLIIYLGLDKTTPNWLLHPSESLQKKTNYLICKEKSDKATHQLILYIHTVTHSHTHSLTSKFHLN